jgi:hypothetical protein
MWLFTIADTNVLAARSDPYWQPRGVVRFLQACVAIPPPLRQHRELQHEARDSWSNRRDVDG